MANLDRDTYNVQVEGEKMYDIVHSEAWAYLKDKIAEQVLDLQSIKNIDRTQKPEIVIMEMEARNVAIDILMDFLRDTEGRAEQHKANQGLMPKGDEHIGFIE